MKSALFSVRPEWCRRIATGEKTIEVRKTAPMLPTPYKGYLYCTDGKTLYRSAHDGEIRLYSKKAHQTFEHHTVFNRKVWAEFICDADLPLLFECNDPAALVTHCEVPGTCLSDVEIMEYLGNGKQGHDLHISDLKIYDKPREIREFFKPCIKDGWPYCKDCEHGVQGNEAMTLLPRTRSFDVPCGNRLNRPPQSWCYVEEVVT